MAIALDNKPTTTSEPKRDRFGRYLIPDPTTGKEKAWTRATTIADTLDDRYNLELWKVRTAAVGLAKRHDLLALVAAHHDDKKQLDRICSDALEAGKASEGANLGTALHALTERVDRGDSNIVLPPQLAADVDAYQQVMAASGLTIATLPDGRLAREVIVVCPELGAAGTADHLFAVDDELLVGDLKTGASAIAWAMTSISIQLSIYAHATHIFDPVTGVLVEKPATSTSNAVVIHLPAGQATCTLYDVDIEAGWEAAQHALWTRSWRKRKGLATERATATVAQSDPFVGVNGEAVAPASSSPSAVPTSPVTPPAETPTFPRVEWIAGRIAVLPTAGQQLLSIRWGETGAQSPKAMRAVPHRDYTDDEIAAINTVLEVVEREHEAPFPPPDPCAAAAVTTEATTAAGRAAQDAAAGDAPSSDAGGGDDQTGASSGEADTTSPAAVHDEGDPVSDDDIDAIGKAIARAGHEQELLVRKWLTQMKDAGVPLGLTQVRSRRRWSIARAVLGLSVFDDEIAEACLAVVLGDDQINHPVGVELIGLSTEEAERVADMARALEAGTLGVGYSDDGVCQIIPAP